MAQDASASSAARTILPTPGKERSMFMSRARTYAPMASAVVSVSSAPVRLLQLSIDQAQALGEHCDVAARRFGRSRSTVNDS